MSFFERVNFSFFQKLKDNECKQMLLYSQLYCSEGYKRKLKKNETFQMPAPLKVAINCFLAICIALILLTSCIQSSAIALFVVWVYNLSYSMSPSYNVYDSQISSLAAASILSIATTMIHSFLTLFSYGVVQISSRNRTRLFVYVASVILSPFYP